jgi:hypothetical protein
MDAWESTAGTRRQMMANALTAAMNNTRPTGDDVVEKVNAALNDIAAERSRQIESEGWTADHDDAHGGEELARAAACYAIGWQTVRYRHIDGRARGEEWGVEWRDVWPWDREWWKPKDHRRNLIKAGALIVAEIERIDRAALKVLEG